MHKKYNHGEFEKKWQEKWATDGLYDVGERDSSKEKEYILTEWPYPSGNLHIGHWYAFAVPDIYARFKRMTGKQVLYPMGFDAFGLPAENAAIKHDTDPKAWTNSNIDFMRSQLASMGNSFSWDKTCSSTDPEYYKWTQWMFGEFFKNDIAYRGEGTVNWCPGCNTVIANEQVQADDTCERCDSPIEKRKMPQWMLRITDFADDLVDELDDLNWPEFIKESQRNWIGRSEGAEIDFKLSTDDKISVFTTRPDTLFGVTYMVLAPEHELVLKNKDKIGNWDEVEKYIEEAKKKGEQDRLDATKEKTGVKLEGITATNPVNNEEIPVYIADYVMAGYGTGAIMAVPAHDERDHEFATKYEIEIKQVIGKIFGENGKPEKNRTGVYALLRNEKGEYLIQHFKKQNFHWLPGGGLEEDESIEECLLRELKEEAGFSDFKNLSKLSELFIDHSSRSDGVQSRNHSIIYTADVNTEDQGNVSYTEAEIEHGLNTHWVSIKDLEAELSKGSIAERAEFIKTVISLADDSVQTESGLLLNSGEFDGMDSEEAKVAITEKVGGKMTSTYRLRDWSIGRQRYWGVPIPIVYDPEGKAHSVPKEHLPWTLPEDVDFKPTGEAPLAKSAELKKRTEEIFGKGWAPEVETMDTFVDSSWYFLRYLDNKNDEELASGASQRDWMPIDLYFGGAEHTTMHLLYSRFWMKALHKLGLVEHKEPYTRRINRGLIMGPDGNKMSKSKGNVVDPDEQVKLVGADTVKMYLAFMGPYAEVNSYPFDLGGIAGIHRFLERVNGLDEHFVEEESEETTALLHKTIKKVREDVVEFKFNTAISAMMVYINHVEKAGLTRPNYGTLLQLLAPFAPFLAEELWSKHHDSSVHLETYPEFEENLTKDETVVIGVQINGKLRGDIELSPDATEEVAVNMAKNNAKLQAKLDSKEVVKIIYVPGRILNFILKNE